MTAFEHNALSPASRERVVRMLKQTRALLAEPVPDSAGLLWLIALPILGVGLAIGLAVAEVGVVEYPSSPSPLLGAAGYGLAASLIAFGLLFGQKKRLGRLVPWRAGRYLFPFGYVDARSATLRYLPLRRLRKVLIDDRGPVMNLRHYAIELIFAGGRGEEEESVSLSFLGRPEALPRDALLALPRRGEEEERLAGDRAYDALSPDELVGDEEMERAARRGPGRPEGADREGAARAPEPGWAVRNAAPVSLLLGALSAAVAFAAVFPRLSMAEVDRSPSIERYAAVAEAFPFPDVERWALRGQEVRRRQAREALPRLAAEPYRALLEELLVSTERSGDPEIPVRLLGPPMEERRAVDAQLDEQARLSPIPLRPIPVVFHSDGLISGVRLPLSGAGSFATALDAGLRGGGVPHDVFHFSSASLPEDALPAHRGPELRIAVHVGFGGVLRSGGQGGFAALRFTFAPSVSRPGQPDQPLCEPIEIAAPDHLSISRMGMIGLPMPGLGSSGDPLMDRLDASLVYSRMLDQAASRAADRLAATLMQGTHPLAAE